MLHFTTPQHRTTHLRCLASPHPITHHNSPSVFGRAASRARALLFFLWKRKKRSKRKKRARNSVGYYAELLKELCSVSSFVTRFLGLNKNLRNVYELASKHFFLLVLFFLRKVPSDWVRDRSFRTYPERRSVWRSSFLLEKEKKNQEKKRRSVASPLRGLAPSLFRF